jgi:putative aminopeptidase FrvX
MTLPEVDIKYLTDFLVRLLNTHSPTGMAEPAIQLVEQELRAFGQLALARTRKGALVASWNIANDEPRVALTAHVDTLGAMVKEIKPNGRLRISAIGGLLLNAVETEGCWVFSSNGEQVRGSLLTNAASAHVFGAQAVEMKRDEEHMEIRLDAKTTSAAETWGLGIRVGDFVAFDPRVEVTNGFIRSRYLDDKACVAAMLAAIRSLSTAGLSPSRSVLFHFSNYEEVSHGAAAGIPENVHELVTVDMAAVGPGQNSDEYHATICLKDSNGPYHAGLSNKLRALAQSNHIDYRTDIYPFYGSDGEAFWRAGGDAAVALIGPGVDASHNYERTHIEALVDTARWILAYLLVDSG